MENAARNGMKRWLGSDPWPKVIAVVTIVAFTTAYSVFNIQPWGPWCAGALTLAWGIFVIAYGARQARRDGHLYSGMTFREQLVRRPVAAFLRILMSLAWLFVGGALLWLRHTHAPQAQVDVANAIFWTLLLTSWIIEISVDSIYGFLERRRIQAG